MTVNNSFVSLGDIPNTIFDVQKKKLNPYGISILKDIPKDRIIQFCGYEWSKYAREKAGAKNYLPPLECANFKNGNKYIYDEKDSYINEKKKVFSSDIEKVLYSEFYYIAEDKSVLISDNSYIKFYVDKNNYPKQGYKVTINAKNKKSTLKTFALQDDKTKDIIAQFKYPRKKPESFSFVVPEKYIQQNSIVKLNILLDKTKVMYEGTSKVGMTLESIEVEVE